MSRYFWPIFTPSPSVTLCHTSRDPPTSTSHISDLPRFLVGLVQNTRTKAPGTNSLLIVLRGFFLGYCQWFFCLEYFIRDGFYSFPLLSQYICYNRKLNITLNFMFHMYNKIFYKCDVTCSLPPSLCHKLSHLLGPPPHKRDVLYGRPINIPIKVQ